MKLARVDDRLVALTDEGALDIEKLAGNDCPDDVFEVISRWEEFAALVAAADLPGEPVDPRSLQAPIPLPRQVFAVGLNYRDHADEVGIAVAGAPPVFTKFPTCITGPEAHVALPSSNVDYELELVVVVGRPARNVSADHALEYVAGYMVGQDLSDRVVQFEGATPQFSIGKSYAGFGPTGPAVVGREEIPDVHNLQMECRIGDETLQTGTTADLIFGVDELVARLSAVCQLLPGDLIFTGTPAGVGMAATPQRFVRPGETLTSQIEAIGEIHTTFVTAEATT